MLFRSEQREINTARGDLKMREDALAAERAALTGVINSHNAERARWEEARKTVDGGHEIREDRLRVAAAAHAAQVAAQNTKDADLRAREAALAAREAKYGEIGRRSRALAEIL